MKKKKLLIWWLGYTEGILVGIFDVATIDLSRYVVTNVKFIIIMFLSIPNCNLFLNILE